VTQDVAALADRYVPGERRSSERSRHIRELAAHTIRYESPDRLTAADLFQFSDVFGAGIDLFNFADYLSVAEQNSEVRSTLSQWE